jgi:acyl-CoA synthetase (AMP-forming)/AMP-acid ligase II
MSNLFDLLQRHAAERPDAPAVRRRLAVGGDQTVTFAELAAAARRWAWAFDRRLPPAAIVPMCLGRSPACLAAMLGALGSGRTFAILNPKLRRPQVARILADTRAAVALIDGAGLAALRDHRGDPGLGDDPAVSSAAGVEWWLVEDSGSGAGPMGPSHRRLAERFAASARLVPSPADSADPDDARAAARFVPPPAADDPSGIGCVLFTSGSTGTPKGVMVPRGDLSARAWAEVGWFGLGSSDILLNILPFSFDVGLNQALTAAAAGCEIVLLDSWLPRDILRTVAERSVTGISAVPSIWLDFMAAGLSFDASAGGPHRSLRYITVSGGDMSARDLARLPSVAPGVGIFKTYGQTEDFRSCSLRPHEFTARPGSVGRPFAGVRVYIIREDGSPAAPGEIGEVVHTGLGVMAGYLGGSADAPGTQGKLRPNPFRGPDDPSPMAVFTGDLGRLDSEGYLFLTGRRDDMVKIHGNRVYPAEVREQLLAVEGVQMAEVVPLKGADRTRLAAAVVPVMGSALTAAQVRLRMSALAPSYMVPEVILIKNELPRTASGKPDRPALALEAAGTLEPAGVNA